MTATPRTVWAIACGGPACTLRLSVEGHRTATEARAEARRRHGWAWVPGPVEWIDLCPTCLPVNVPGPYARRGGRKPAALLRRGTVSA